MRHLTLITALVTVAALSACRTETRESDRGDIDTLSDTARRNDPADAEITIGTENKRVVVPDVDVTDSSIKFGKDTVTMKVPTVKTNP